MCSRFWTNTIAGGTYPLIRAAMTVLMRELNIYTLIGDMFAGRPSAYATFVGYDEIAHHSGVLDPGAFDALHKLDQQFARLESVIKDAPRPYHLVILSDHGQTGGATFLQRYGKSLEEFVQELMTDEHKVETPVDSSESYGTLNAFLDRYNHQRIFRMTQFDAAASLRDKTHDGEVMLGPEGHEIRQESVRGQRRWKRKKKKNRPSTPWLPAIWGLISFTQWPERMTMEEIDEAFPAVLPGLANHEGIGFVMVRSEEHGPGCHWRQRHVFPGR